MTKKNRKQAEMSARELRIKTCLNTNTPFMIKEAYKVARTNLMFSLPEEGCKIIAVTSSSPGEGKTTTCVNMALSFGQAGKKVLLIDGDLRKAQIHHIFKQDNQQGLSNILGGFTTAEEGIKSLSDYSIHLLTAGSVPPNPAELLGSERMRKLLNELRTEYDYIFIDTPPINIVTDAIVISAHASGVVLVTREDDTTHKDLDCALERLNYAKAKVLGLILTGEKYKNRMGKYRKYGKYGKYGRYSKYSGYSEYLSYE